MRKPCWKILHAIHGYLVWTENLTNVARWWGLGDWFVCSAELPRCFNFTFYFAPSINCRPCSWTLVCTCYYVSVHRTATDTQLHSNMWLHFSILIFVYVAFLYQIFYAVFAFQARSDQELSLQEYQRVRILRFSDLSGNTEWWLAEAKGQTGYVPSNYLGKMTYA